MSQDPRAPKPLTVRSLPPRPTQNSRTPQQMILELHIEKQAEINGVGMGVLSDGTPFLTGRGLARLCGVDSSRISEIASGWATNSGAAKKVKALLLGTPPEMPYIELKMAGSSPFHAYSDVICIAVLEYYGYEAPLKRLQAKKNFKLLAGKALAEFIFDQVGYDPTHSVPDEWRQFHDRVSLTYNAVPKGYFGVFKEISEMIITLAARGKSPQPEPTS